LRFLVGKEDAELLVPIYLGSELILCHLATLCDPEDSIVATTTPLKYLADVYRLLPVTETWPIQNRKKGQDRLHCTAKVVQQTPKG
jgi:hypothetical protein